MTITVDKRALATIDELCARFPRAFFRDVAARRPLKIGINVDLAIALKAEISSWDVRAALAMYTSSAWYRRKLIAGTARIDLDGNPSGEVSEKHAAIARQQLAPKPTPAPAPAQTPKPTPGPKPETTRDGIATLKAAAALRRQQQ